MTGHEGKQFSERDAWQWSLNAALETRRLEIELFWRRATFFWGFQIAALTVVGLAVRIDGGDHDPLRLVTLNASLIIGFWAAVAGYLSARGAKYWQEVWEYRLEELEPFPMFAASTTRTKSFLGPGCWSVSKQYITFLLFIIFLWVLSLLALPAYLWETTDATLDGPSKALTSAFVGLVAIVVSVLGQWLGGATHSIRLVSRDNRRVPAEFEAPSYIDEGKTRLDCGGKNDKL